MNRLLSFAMGFVFTLGIVSSPWVAHAITDPFADPTLYASGIPGGAAAWSCETGCEKWVDEKGNFLAPDAQTCADLGAPYDSTASSLSSPIPTASMTAEQADTYISCVMANTQVVAQCQAYRLNQQAEKGQSLVLPLDIAAAAICWNACAGLVTPAGAAANTACEVAGAAASAGEFIELARLNQLFGEVTGGRTLEMMGAGVAALGAAGGAAYQVSGAVGASKAGAQYRKMAASERGMAENLHGLEDMGADPAAANGSALGSSHSEGAADRADAAADQWDARAKEASGEYDDSAQQDGAKKMACLTAATLTALSAARGISWGVIASNKKKACDAAESLMNGSEGSSVASVSSAGLVPGGAASWQATGSTSSGDGGETTTSSSDSESADSSEATSTDECLSGLTSCDSSGTASAATDGQLLTRSGLDRAAAKLLQGKDLGALLGAARRGGAGAAIAGLASQLGLAKGGSEIASIASAIEAKRERFLGAVAGSAYARTAAGSRVTAQPAGLLSGLFPAGKIATAESLGFPARGPAGGATGGIDIWHSGTELNIFQIVSNRIGAVTPRLK